DPRRKQAQDRRGGWQEVAFHVQNPGGHEGQRRSPAPRRGKQTARRGKKEEAEVVDAVDCAGTQEHFLNAAKKLSTWEARQELHRRSGGQGSCGLLVDNTFHDVPRPSTFSPIFVFSGRERSEERRVGKEGRW